MKDDTLKRLEAYENYDIDGEIKEIIDMKEVKGKLRTRNVCEGVLVGLTNEFMDEDTYEGFWEMVIEDSYSIEEIFEVLMDAFGTYSLTHHFEKEDI